MTIAGRDDRSVPNSFPVAGTVVVKTVAVLLGAALLGVALCVLKGDGSGLRDWLGNASAPYVIAAFGAGLTTRRSWLMAAISGIAATEAMLGGFYSAWDALLQHEVSSYALTVWCTAGVVSGAAFGVAGWVAVAHPAVRYLVPALLILEPLAQRIAALSGRFGGLDVPLEGLEAYAIEVVIGVAALLLVRRSMSRPAPEIQKQPRPSRVSRAG